MKTHCTSTALKLSDKRNPNSQSFRRRQALSRPVGIVGVLLLVIAAAFYTSSSISASRSASRVNLPTEIEAGGIKDISGPASRGLKASLARSSAPGYFSTLMSPLFLPGDEAVATFEVVSNACTATPKTTFVLGDKVCVKVENAPLRAGAPLRRINFTGTKGFVRDTVEVTTDPQESVFTLPTDITTVIDGATIDNRGIWSASSNSTADGGTRAIAYFNVSDPDNEAADLVLYQFSTSAAAESEGILPGSNTGFLFWLSNTGPDSASDVHLTMAVPANMTYQSASTSSAFTCAEDGGVVDCSVATWASGAIANITINFMVSAGAPNGLINSTSNISSDTNDPRPANNSAEASVEVRTPGAPPATCALHCPTDMVVTATSSSGAVVNFGPGDIEASGDCGTLDFSPASGSLFPVGPNSVTVTSGGGSGGSCTFTVTVIDSPAPTIDCPLPDITAAAPSGEGEATVSVTPPSATGTGVSVIGVRNDNRDLADPYPVGTTIITWTATDSNQRTASCTQKVIVTSADFPTIQCPLADVTLNAGGSCAATAVITPPTYGGPGAVLTSQRGDFLPLTDPFPAGQTIITWTVTNALGSISCTQLVIVTNTGNGSSPPVLTVPADVEVTTNTCSALIDDELGVATATDVCESSVNISRTGVPTVPCPIPGNPTRVCESFIFPVGTTEVTYTATNSAGLTATGVQRVTVHGLTPPQFTFVPASIGPINNDAGLCGAFIGDATLGMATVLDTCDSTVIRTGVPAGNIFPVGQTTITFTAKADLSVTATQIVTVVDNTLPVVTPPAAVTLYTGAGATSCGVTVSDLDATLGTGSATDNCPGVGPVTRSGVPAGNVFPVGTTTVTYSATDASNNTGSATQVVTVVDNTVPVITVNGSMPSMWPPNHKYQTFQLTGFVTGATDNCGSVSLSNVVIEKVTSDETENGNGDGNTNNDIIIAGDCKSVQLRAERQGGGNGRVYTITFKVTDTHGNVGRATSKIVVPHNPGQTPIDNGVQYTVNGTCP